MNIILFSRKQVNHRPEQLRELFATLARLGIDYSINEDFASVVKQLIYLDIAPERVYGARAVGSDDDVMVTYGGDGTLLDAVQLLPSSEILVVGINCGRLGYLTADNGDGIADLIERIARGDIAYQRRDMIHIEGDIDGLDSPLALNEIALHRGGASMISIETFVDDKRVATYHGDGLVVSTPTGSTAYSMAAGGAIVDPRLNCFCVTPICPHSLSSKPLVFPDFAVINIKNICQREKILYLTVDGRANYELYRGESVRITKSDLKTKFISLKESRFYTKLRLKMNEK